MQMQMDAFQLECMYLIRQVGVRATRFPADSQPLALTTKQNDITCVGEMMENYIPMIEQKQVI